MKKITNTVIKILSKQLKKKIEFFKTDHNLFKDLEIDSLDFIEFIMSIEEEFNIEIPDSKSQSIKTIKDCILCIKKIKKLDKII